MNLKHHVEVLFIGICSAFVSVKQEILMCMFFSSSQGGGYMFEFDNVGSRDSCRDFVGNAHSVYLLGTSFLDLVLASCYINYISHYLKF